MTAPLTRQRKTKEPCDTCFLHVDRCICAQIPQLDLATRLCLVIHAKELKRTTNTGRLAVKALVNSEMLVRGDDRSGLDLTEVVARPYTTLLLYPSEDAVELTPTYVKTIKGPIQLIVPDGNWRQAGKIHYRHKELSHVQRVTLKNPSPSSLHMRLETVPEGMATLEAIAHAFGAIEGEEVHQSLMNLYQAKLQNTLIGRGTIKSRAPF